MSHEEIKLATPTRMFTFEQLSRDIDKINDVDTLREMAKSHIKLYLLLPTYESDELDYP